MVRSGHDLPAVQPALRAHSVQKLGAVLSAADAEAHIITTTKYFVPAISNALSSEAYPSRTATETASSQMRFMDPADLIHSARVSA
ncbi:MAG: hypothetical protein J5494_03805, partial [Candidatus Methanomethylophilaceae archaeon]|nr:hypothetical protein [Candidatus Methanomethylophilaceae archaeon]